MSRRGAALPAALLAMVVAEALAVATLAAARLRYLSGHRQLALAEASAATSGAVAWWQAELSQTGWADSLVVGRSLALPPRLSLPSRLRTSDTVLRLSASLVLVRSTGERLDAGGSVLARDQLDGIIRIDPR